MSEEMKNIIALKQRAEKMLKKDYSKKIGDEEIYTIICEWEKNFDLYKKEKEKNEELNMKLLEKDLHIDGLKEDRRIAVEEIKEEYFVSKDKIKAKIEELEGQEDWYIENNSLDDLYGRIDELKELLKEE